MENKLRVGIIGAGNWARNAHFPAFNNQSGVTIMGITDIDPGRARKFSEDFHVPFYANLEEMLATNELDILDIITSRGQHFEPALAGIGKELALLCEKPLGHNLTEARTLAHAATRKKLITQMGFTFRYSPAIRYVHDLVQQGFLGEIYHFQGFEENAQLVDPQTPLPRIGFSRKTDSGALQGFGSHLLDLARWMLGEFERVIGDMETYIKERPIFGEPGTLPVTVDDSTTVLARFESGVQGMMQFSKIAMGNAPGVEMRIFGSRAALWVRLEETPSGYEHLWSADFQKRDFRPLPVPSSYMEEFENTNEWAKDYFSSLVDSFCARVRAGKIASGYGDFNDGLQAQIILEAIERSHLEERWVSLSELNE